MRERERERERYTGSQRATDTNWNDILEVHCYVVDNNALTKAFVAETSSSHLLLIEFATYVLIKINLMLPIGMIVTTCLVESLCNLILCLQSGGNMRVSLLFLCKTLQVVCQHTLKISVWLGVDMFRN